MTRRPKTFRRLAVAGAIAGAFFYGVLAGSRGLPPVGVLRSSELGRAIGRGLDLVVPRPAASPQGPRSVRFHPAAEPESRVSEALQSLGYLAGYHPAEGSGGVSRHDPARTEPGLNLAVDGHAPEAVLFDMEGRTLHRWSHRFADAFPGEPLDDASAYWRRATLLPDGGLLAIHEGRGLIRLDRESRLLWSRPNRAHHDLEVQPDGTIVVLTRDTETLSDVHPDEPVTHDFVSILDAAGNEQRRISLLDAIRRSSYSALLRLGPRAGDLLHTNTVEVLDGSLADRIPAFARGNLLVSLHRLHTIAVIDRESGLVVWALTGRWRYQHEPTVLPNGRLLLFDNLGAGGFSRVLELDPRTQEIVWSYDGRQHDFRSEVCGASQRLGNGNTLITESTRGRAFEVEPGGDVVWDYRTPNRAGENGEKIATLFEVRRLAPDAPGARAVASVPAP